MKQILLALLLAPLAYFAQDNKTASNQRHSNGPETITQEKTVIEKKGVSVSDKKNEPAASTEVINTNTVGTTSNRKDSNGESKPEK